MYCPECGAKLEAGAQYCYQCGGGTKEEICPYCGIKNLNKIDICRCGFNFISPEASSFHYYGVGGWLLLFVIGLTILSPLRFTWEMAVNMSGAMEAIELYPQLAPSIYFDLIVSTIILIFAVYTGIYLWAVKSGAVKLAKTFLIVVLCYNVLSLLLGIAVSSGLPSEAESIMVIALLSSTLPAFLAFFIWYAYLSKSKRVRATYFFYDKQQKEWIER